MIDKQKQAFAAAVQTVVLLYADQHPGWPYSSAAACVAAAVGLSNADLETILRGNSGFSQAVLRWVSDYGINGSQAVQSKDESVVTLKARIVQLEQELSITNQLIKQSGRIENGVTSVHRTHERYGI